MSVGRTAFNPNNARRVFLSKFYKSAEITDLDHLETGHYLECWKQILECIEMGDSKSIPRTNR